MKKLTLQTTLAALCAAGLMTVARAQNDQPPNQAIAPEQETNAAAVTPEQGDAAGVPQPEVIPVPADAGPNGAPDMSAGTNQPAVTEAAAPGMPEDRPAAPVAERTLTPDDFIPPAGVGTNADELRLNFRNAPLEEVLNYLSDAAGFIIVLDAEVHGSVSVISSHPMTRNEAVDLLNAVLNRNGLAAIRNGRTLTIVSKDDAKTRNIPVKVSNEPAEIPDNAEIVTEIIPIRFVEAEQLAKDLSLFVSPQATIVANEAGNSIVVTDTQSNIRHLAEIIRAVDDSAEGETEIRVFHLAHANPTDVANELSAIFPSNNGSTGSTSQSPIRFGGGGGFFGRIFGGGGGPGGGGGGGGAAGASGNSARMQKQTQVLATPDLRTSSVIVTASKDLMQEIAGMMDQLDVPSTRDQKVFVYHMNNADPNQALQVLQSMFGGTTGNGQRGGTTSGSSTTSGDALLNRQTQNASSSGTGSSSSSTGIGSGIGGGGGGGRAGGF